jgi:hypothetical protein
MDNLAAIFDVLRRNLQVDIEVSAARAEPAMVTPQVPTFASSLPQAPSTQTVMPLQVEFDKRNDEGFLAREILIDVRNADACSRADFGNGRGVKPALYEAAAGPVENPGRAFFTRLLIHGTPARGLACITMVSGTIYALWQLAINCP